MLSSPPKGRPLVYLILTAVNKADGPVPGDIGMQGVWGKRYLQTGKTAKWYFQDFFFARRAFKQRVFKTGAESVFTQLCSA